MSLKKLISLFAMLFGLLFGQVIAQVKTIPIRLLDADDNQPIVQATYNYGNQNGLSDANGIIKIRFETDAQLKLSHVNYGSWVLDEDQLRNVFITKEIRKKSIVLNLHPVTIIALRSTQSNDEITLTHPDRLEHDGADLLNQLPAFNSIRKSGNYGFDPVFRGFKYDQLNIVLNGAQSATAACPNRMDPPTSQMAPNMIERIEVLKGPYALRFGTGFGATINFVPEDLNFTSQPGFTGRASTGYESNGNVRRGEGKIGFNGEHYDVSFFSAWSEGDDYETGNSEKVASAFTRGSFGTSLGFKLSGNQQLRLSATYNRARDVDFPALAMDLRTDDTWMFSARHDIQLNRKYLKSWNTTVYGSFVDHLMDNLTKPLNPRMLNAKTDATTYNYGARSEGMWKLGNALIYGGADVRIEGAEGIRTRSFLMGPNAGNTFEDNAWQDGRISKSGVFAQYQFSTTNFDYIFSGRLVLNQADVNDPSQEYTQVYPLTQVTQVNPNASVGILKTIGQDLQAGLWMGRAQRSGSLTERFINYFPVGQDPFEMLGNPDLNPEVNYQTDITLEWTPSSRGRVNVDLFYSYLNDYISSVIDPTLAPRLPNSPGVRRFINIDNAFKTGFEINWLQQLTSNLQQQLTIAYTYGKDLERNDALPEIAPLDIRYSIMGRTFRDKLTPEIIMRYVATQSRISSEFGESETPNFTLIDVKIGYSLSESISVIAGVNNVFDETYYEHLNRSVRGSMNPIFAPGRNVFATVNFNF